LIEASTFGKTDTVELLVKAKADVNAKNNDVSTPAPCRTHSTVQWDGGDG
jgi:ankyrin repeat protein